MADVNNQSKMAASLLWKFIIGLILSVVLLCKPSWAQITTPPQNITVNKGQTVEFVCNTTSASDTIQWVKYTPSPVTISSSAKVFDTSGKYFINGTYNLVIDNVDVVDGVPYSCSAAQFQNIYFTNLIVVQNLEASVFPSSGISAGENVTLNCMLNYGGPTVGNSINPLSPNQDLHLSMFLSGTNITSLATGVQITGTPVQPIHSKSLAVSLNVTDSDANKLMECIVTSINPPYMEMTQLTLPISYATYEVFITTFDGNMTSSGSTYNTGSTLNCSADGYPLPQVTWIPLLANLKPNTIMNGPGFAVLSLTQLGFNLWNCTASNSPLRVVEAFRAINFTVVDPLAQQSNSAPAANIGLGVGIGVGLGVPILLAVIILIVILMRRKKTKNIEKTKENKKTPSTGTGNPTARDAANRKPPTGMEMNGGINPNPNPTYMTPVMPEQRTGPTRKRISDSPGYGDLGVRNLGASGSMPQLNESFDSTTERNYGANRRPDYARSNDAYLTDQGQRPEFTGQGQSYDDSRPGTSSYDDPNTSV